MALTGGFSKGLDGFTAKICVYGKNLLNFPLNSVLLLERWHKRVFAPTFSETKHFVNVLGPDG